MSDANEQVWGADKSLTLAELTDWLWDKESGWGPVIDIGHTTEGTAATFRYAAGTLAKPEIRPVMPGQQLVVAGKTEVCRGTVFILNALQLVAVFR